MENLITLENQAETLSQKSNEKIEKQKIYTREEVYKATLEYFKGDELAADVWTNKYCLKDSNDNFYELTPNDMHWRIARELSRIENKYANPIDLFEIYESIKEFKYIVPQGSPMAGIGNNLQFVSLSNCFVIGNENDSDSYGGILKLDQELVHLQKRRAGVGLDLSFLRPDKSPVQNAAITSTGVVPFMERYSNSTREVAQDGRRGALMESLSINHPDAEAFIDAKMDEKKVTGANISVRITDEFMNAVLNNQPFTQRYPVDSITPKFTKEINATFLWKKIIHNAWKRAEPGILFWDTIIRESIPDCYADLGFKTQSTNPCGEITLSANDSCRLLLLNYYSYVKNPFTKNAEFDFELFKKHCKMGQRFMDDIIDLELEKIDSIINKIISDPEDEFIKQIELNLWRNIKKACQTGRRTGFGATGEADMLAAMGLRYGTDEANKFSALIHRVQKLEAYRESVNLAKERGAFPIYDSEREKNNPFIKRIKNEDPALYKLMVEYGRRNIALLTQAPCGSASLMTQTSSGIECAFLIFHTRRRKINPTDKNAKVDFIDSLGDKWQEYPIFHHKFKIWLEVNGYNFSEVEKMSTDEILKLIELSPYHKATSNDVDWVKKVEMQGMIQKEIDHSISVTINIPKETTEETVAKIYETAWRVGCKGMTIYRDGSRSGVLVSKEEKKEEVKELVKENHAPKRPKKLEADIVRFINKGEKWIAFVGLYENKPYEIFTGKLEAFPILNTIEKGFIVKQKNEDGSKRYDFEYSDSEGYKVTIEGLSRSFEKEYWNNAKFLSALLRHGMPINYVIELIDGLSLEGDTLHSWKSGVIRALKRYVKDGTEVSGRAKNCEHPELQCNVVFEEGCMSCKTCGLSKCS